MREGVVSEIVAVATKAAHACGPEVKEILGRQVLFLPKGDGTFEQEDKGGPGVGPHALALHTLSGLVAYLQAPSLAAAVQSSTPPSYPLGRDGSVADTVIVHVVNHAFVRVLSALDGAYRTEYATAAWELLIGAPAVPFAFGKYLDPENFNIALQVLFEDTPDRNRVALVTGTIRDEMVKTSTDDGVTQRVISQAGVVGAYEQDVPNPVRLKPFRTFRDVEQPESLFVLRLKKGENGQLPTCALFEADGGAWKVEAIKRIAEYLRSNLPGVSVLA